MNRIFRKITLLVLAALVLSGGTAWAKSRVISGQNLCFNPERPPVENRYYKEVTEKREGGLSFEQAKIKYLIEAVRVSPFTFIRNGVPYKGTDAASHLRMKYGHGLDRVKTTQSFIDFLASASLASGRPYLVKFSDGKTYPAKDLFYNELARLEDFLQTSPPAPETTAS